MVFISLLGYSEYHADLLNGQSADGTSAERAVAAAGALEAVAEALTPSPAGLGLVSLAGPVGALLEFLLKVGVEQRLFAAGGQAGDVFTALLTGPLHGFVPGDVVGLAG